MQKKVLVRHISGSAILPSDFANLSKHSPKPGRACHICTSTKSTQDSVVRVTSVQDILRGNDPLCPIPTVCVEQSSCNPPTPTPPCRRLLVYHLHKHHHTLPTANSQTCTKGMHHFIYSHSVFKCVPWMVHDSTLKQHRITLRLVLLKNQNKNTVAEWAVQEVQRQLLHHDPGPGCSKVDYR